MQDSNLLQMLKLNKMDTKDLINWGELSRMLSGSRQTVRKNKIPKIHQPFVDELIKVMDKVINKRTKDEAGS